MSPSPRSLRLLLAAFIAASIALGALACDDGTSPNALPVYDADFGDIDASTLALVNSALPTDANDAGPAVDANDGAAEEDASDGAPHDGAPHDGGDASHDAHFDAE